MKNNITELVFLLDRSGSMSGLESDTVGGFNSFIEKQKKNDGKCLVSTVLFDHESIVVHDRVEISEILPMTDREYTVRGSTALIDAMGNAIRHISNIHKYARPEDVPEHTVFVITTDGMENASTVYTAENVKKLVEDKKKNYGWEFIFMGANIDAVETAKRYGISKDRAVEYYCDSAGISENFSTLDCVVSSVRASKPISEGWKDNVTEYLKSKRK